MSPKTQKSKVTGFTRFAVTKRQKTRKSYLREMQNGLKIESIQRGSLLNKSF